MLLCKACLFSLPLLLLHLCDTRVLELVDFHTQLVFIGVTSYISALKSFRLLSGLCQAESLLAVAVASVCVVSLP